MVAGIQRRSGVVIHQRVLVDRNFRRKSVVLSVVVRLLLRLVHHQIAPVVFSFLRLDLVQIVKVGHNVVLLVGGLTHTVSLHFLNCAVDALLRFFDAAARGQVFICVSLRCGAVGIVALDAINAARGNLLKQRRLKVELRVLRAHLTYPHVFSLVLHYDLLKQVVLLGGSLLSRLRLVVLLLLTLLIQIR